MKHWQDKPDAKRWAHAQDTCTLLLLATLAMSTMTVGWWVTLPWPVRVLCGSLCLVGLLCEVAGRKAAKTP